jgi:hypothetical protein
VQVKNNLSHITGNHTFKAGVEWMHTLNDQVFRGFFTDRYLLRRRKGKGSKGISRARILR